MPPGDNHFTAKNYCCINDLLNKLSYSSGLAGRTLFMTNLVHRDAGIAARLSFGAMRPFRFGRWPAEAGTHKLFAGVAGHAARLRVAVLHSLLLRRELGARWHGQHAYHGDGDQIPIHRASLSPVVALPGSRS